MVASAVEALVALILLLLFQSRTSFSFEPTSKRTFKPRNDASGKALFAGQCADESLDLSSSCSRRSLLFGIGSAIAVGGGARDASAAVGTLPEFQETNAILQGLIINVVDQSQLKSMVEFLTQGFGFEVLRQRIRGPVEETVSFYIEADKEIILSFTSSCVLTMKYCF
jgi:hypothetical protein